MKTEIAIEGADAKGSNYLTWTPVKASIKLLEAPDANPVSVVLSNDNETHGGQMEFSTARNLPRSKTLTLTLPADGTPVDFFVAGQVGKPSIEDKDAIIKCLQAGTPTVLSTKQVMVRVRKSTESMTDAERDRFVIALSKVNKTGSTIFQSFRDMHKETLALRQAHGAPGFLSWHRAYLLDLERALQVEDPSVTLPYWRFDAPAPKLFAPRFFGRTNVNTGVLDLTGNVLINWSTDGQTGIARFPGFDQVAGRPSLFDEAQTLAIGGTAAIFDGGAGAGFDEMEGNPHGDAHTSFDGFLFSPATAPRDPLFFLLHCNVDRLWALWQWRFNRYDGTQSNTYRFRGAFGSNPSTRAGHNLLDTMWPWNNVTSPADPNRPANAPRHPFPTVPIAPGPGATPTVGNMIDYQGFLNAPSYMGFCYDVVPYGVRP